MSARATHTPPPPSRTDEHWSLAALPGTDRAEAWRDVVARTHLPWRIAAHDPPAPVFDTWVRRRRLGDLSLLDCACHPCAGRRGRDELRRTDGEYVAVLIVLSGREVISQSGREAVLGPGDLVLWDGVRQTGFAVLAPLRKRTLLVPRSLLTSRVAAFDRVTARPVRGVGADLLSAHLAAVSAAPSLDAESTGAAMVAALELLSSALAPASRAGAVGLRAGVVAMAYRYIDAWLGEPGLAPPAVAAACGVSVRTLHLAFEPTGESVCAHIRRRRLERCHEALRGGDAVSVTGVAARWGFTSPAHFSRLFRRVYGIAPRDLARAAAESPRRPDEPR